MGFGGIIAGAMAGGSSAVSGIADGYIQNDRKTELAKQISDIEEAKQKRVADYAEQQRRSGQLFDATDATLVGAKRTNRAADAAIDSAAQIATHAGQAAADTTELSNRVPIAARQAGEVATATSKANADQLIANGNNPAFIRAEKAITAATHFFSPGDALATEQLRKLKEINGQQTLLAGETDPTKREAIQTRIADLSGNTKSVKELALALSQTETAAAKARVTLSDPLASPEAKASATEALEALKMSADNLKKHMGLKEPEKTYPGAPAVGAEVSGMVFKGGNPNDKKNWAQKDKVSGSTDAPATGVVAAKQDAMRGVTFSGDGYTFGGKEYPTAQEAQAARDAAELGNNPTSQSLSKYRD